MNERKQIRFAAPCKDPGPHHLVSIDLIYEAAAEIERLNAWAREERRNTTNMLNAHADALNTIAALTLISAHLASDEAVERAVHKSRVIGILPGRSDAEVMRLTNESVLLGNIADLHLETIKEIIRLQAIADNWQTMKDERDAIRDGYQYLLEDTNIEIAALREEIRHLEKKKKINIIEQQVYKARRGYDENY